ncbi:DoxX family membrane protein [Corynebacterium choanae]|nr:DoxX family membrane protein [Corynebacterium choanae]
MTDPKPTPKPGRFSSGEPINQGELPPVSNGYSAAGRVEPQRIDPIADAPTTVFAANTTPPVATVATDHTPTTTMPVVTDATVESETALPTAVDPAAGKRGTMDFGLLLLRLFFGGYLLLTATLVLFGQGGRSLAGLRDSFSGYAQPEILVLLMPILALAAGLFLLLGLLTPFAAALGVITTGFFAMHAIAISDHSGNLLYWEDTVWLQLALFAMAVALQFTGPGRVSADFSRGWAKRPLASSWLFFVIGVAAAVALWWFTAGVNPLQGIAG